MATGPASILITGASSGIGRALASVYAAPGVHLALTGRDAARLEAVAAACRASGAEVTTAQIDVRDRGALASWIHSVDDRHPFDLAIASAGITTGLGIGRPREDPDAVRATLAINLVGALNTADPVIERMCVRGRGRIAFVGSISAIRGLPYSPAYCASKAAIHAYAESLHGGLARQGVGVSLIVAGFIATPLNEDMVGPKPLILPVERAARIIRRGLDRGAATIAFPRTLYYGAHLLRILPARWADFWLRRFHVDITETDERADSVR